MFVLLTATEWFVDSLTGVFPAFFGIEILVISIHLNQGIWNILRLNIIQVSSDQTIQRLNFDIA